MDPNIAKVRRALVAGGISKQELADEAGLHRNTLATVDQDTWSPRETTLTALSDAVDRIKARRV